MGLFSKHKDKNEDSAKNSPSSAGIPPGPPSAPGSPPPPAAPPAMNAPNGQAMPPAMGAAPSSPAHNVPEGSNLSPPPLPGGTLDEIKKQVSEGMDMEKGEKADGDDEQSTEDDENDSKETSADDDLSEDNLFDMFDMKFPEGKTNLNKENSPKAEEVPKPHHEEQAKAEPKTEEIAEAKTPEKVSKEPVQSKAPEPVTESPFENVVPRQRDIPKTSPSHPIDTSLDNIEAFNFEDNPEQRKDSTFLTTDQFKTLLEIVDSVKAKVKSSSEIHMRMMDMKSEEDIEYESLRKNFQYIEDKLYDLDGIIFDK